VVEPQLSWVPWMATRFYQKVNVTLPARPFFDSLDNLIVAVINPPLFLGRTSTQVSITSPVTFISLLFVTSSKRMIILLRIPIQDVDYIPASMPPFSE